MLPHHTAHIAWFATRCYNTGITFTHVHPCIQQVACRQCSVCQSVGHRQNPEQPTRSIAKAVQVIMLTVTSHHSSWEVTQKQLELHVLPTKCRPWAELWHQKCTMLFCISDGMEECPLVTASFSDLFSQQQQGMVLLATQSDCFGNN